MSRFLNRYLPASERRTALWLVLAGALLSLASAQVGALVRMSAVTTPTSEWTPALVAAVVQFALVAVLVALLIRFARAPRVLALYVVLGAIASTVLAAVGLPIEYLGSRALAAVDPAHTAEHANEWWIPYARSAVEDLAIGLGAVAGAWIAATVSLARLRDTGFSGDAPDGRGLRTKPDSMGWSFAGWDGRPLSGDALIAIALVAVRIIPGLVGVALSGLALFAQGRFGSDVSSTLLTVNLATLALAWVVSAWLVTRRSGVVSLWVVLLAGLLQSAAFVVPSVVTGDVDATFVPLLLLQSLAAPLVFLVAAVGGTGLALRQRDREQAATLAATPVVQDPDAAESASDDTAGG